MERQLHLFKCPELKPNVQTSVHLQICDLYGHVEVKSGPIGAHHIHIRPKAHLIHLLQS